MNEVLAAIFADCSMKEWGAGVDGDATNVVGCPLTEMGLVQLCNCSSKTHCFKVGGIGW